MSSGQGPLDDRRKALEEQFFEKENARLLEELKGKREAEEGRRALAQACGITDDAVLDHLQKLGIEAETVVALALVPLVAVAWANGTLEDAEREAVLRAAGEGGVDSGGPARELLERWLSAQPSPALFRTWTDYARAFAGSLDEAQRASIRGDFVARAKAVAEAAGGFLGLTSKTSAKEQEVIDQIEAALG